MSIEKIQDPNCPTEIWWALAEKHPLEAQASLLYPLLTLEEPERWLQLERNHIKSWMLAGIERLPQKKAELFAADCAHRVLPLFDREFPEDSRPREAIRTRRKYANKKALPSEWKAAKRAAESSCDAAWGLDRNAAGSAANAACDETEDAFLSAGFAVGWHAIGSQTGPRADERLDNARLVETRWQWRRLQQYLQGNPTDEVEQVGAKRDESKALAKVDIAKDAKRIKDAQELRRDLEPYVAQLSMLAAELSEDYLALVPPYIKAYNEWQPSPELRAWWQRWSPPMNEDGPDAQDRRLKAAQAKLEEVNASLGITPKLIRIFTLLSKMLHSIPARPTLTAYAIAYGKLASYLMPNGMYPHNSLVQPVGSVYLGLPPTALWLSEGFQSLGEELNAMWNPEGQPGEVTLDQLREMMHPRKGILGTRLVSIVKRLSQSRQISEDVLLDAVPKKGAK